MIRSAKTFQQQQQQCCRRLHLLSAASPAGNVKEKQQQYGLSGLSAYDYCLHRCYFSKVSMTEFRPSRNNGYGSIYLNHRWKASTIVPISYGVSSHVRTYYGSSSTGSVQIGADPVLDALELQQAILDLAPSMAQGLANDGYWTTTTTTDSAILLPMTMIGLLRRQAMELRRQGRYEQSWSERVVDDGGGRFRTERFDKEGVFACEPDGQDYDIAPDLIVYMSVVLQTLPHALNDALQEVISSSYYPTPDLSQTSFNAKLAVTLPGGSTYPLHVDNPQGLAANDTRKLTCILYLNPDYDAKRGDGGELRLLVRGRGGTKDGTTEGGRDDEDTQINHVDLTPEGGRMVLFWSDEIPHEVLPTAPHYTIDAMQGDEEDDDELALTNPLDRYALTLWIPTENISTIHNEASKFRSLRDVAFPPVVPRGH